MGSGTYKTQLFPPCPSDSHRDTRGSRPEEQVPVLIDPALTQGGRRDRAQPLLQKSTWPCLCMSGPSSPRETHCGGPWREAVASSGSTLGREEDWACWPAGWGAWSPPGLGLRLSDPVQQAAWTAETLSFTGQRPCSQGGAGDTAPRDSSCLLTFYPALHPGAFPLLCPLEHQCDQGMPAYGGGNRCSQWFRPSSGLLGRPTAWRPCDASPRRFFISNQF